MRTTTESALELPKSERPPPPLSTPPAPRPSRPSLPLTQTNELPRVQRGIRVKLVVLMVATISAIVSALASYFPARQLSELRAGLRERAEVYAGLASRQLRSSVAFNDQETAREVLDAVAKDPLIDGIAVYTSNGARLHSGGRLSELAVATRRGLGQPRVFSLPGRVLATAPVQSLEGPRGTVVLELSTRSASEARNRLVLVALAAGLSALALGTALAWLIARSLAERVERVAAASTAVAAGDLEQTLPTDGPNDEIGVLAHGFNAMVEQLRGLIAHVRATAREESARLERLVRERTVALDRKNQDLKLVLDNVDQGFITIDRDALIVGESSRIIETWLGNLTQGSELWSYFEHSAPDARANFAVCWSQVIDGIMPLELTLDQMPRRLALAGRELRLDYKPLLGQGEHFDKMLVILSDVTAIIERERSEQEERDVLNMTSRLLKDRAGFLAFYEETEALIASICNPSSDTVRLKRDLHTLKGNSGMYGLLRLAAICHELESELESLDAESLDRSKLSAQWQRTRAKLKLILGAGQRRAVEVDEADYLWVLSALKRGANPAELATILESWRLEALPARFERVAEQLAATAERLGKGKVKVTCRSARLFLAQEELADFWSVFSHVIRNAAVHGLETAERRLQLGKPETAEFKLSGGVRGSKFFIELRDDGPGVDWERVRNRAVARGLPARTQTELEEALFADGVSTERSVSESAGRGVGLSAVHEVCAKQGASIEISSAPGDGATFRFSWPVSRLRSLVVLEARNAS